jgi:excisionase family DNA binding protein
MPSGLLTVAETARAVHRSKSSVRRLIAKGELRATQPLPRCSVRVWADSVTELLTRDVAQLRPAEDEAAA